MTKNIERVAIADARLKHFIFEIQAHNPRSEDPWDYTEYLLLMDLSMSEPKLVKEINIGQTTAWSANLGKIFMHNLKTGNFFALDKNLNEANHDIVTTINRLKKQIDFTWVHPHPTLPFALLSGGNHGSTYITWDQTRPTIFHRLFSGAIHFSFSPDGKWVVFRKNFPEPQQTYLMPVSEKYPNYLGSPIKLLEEAFGRRSINNNAAWTTNPISYVGSYRNTLYRWELTRDAYPEAGDMDLHDYIVQKDLEKLTREKQQGLGRD